MPQKYLKLYEEHSDYESGSRPDAPHVSHCIEEDHVHYTGLLIVPLTFEAKTGDTTITFKHISPGNFDYTTKTIQVSTDDGKTWESKTSSRPGTVLGTIKKGQKMLIRGNNTKYNGGVTSSYNYFLSDNDVYVYGNLASIVQSTNFWNVADNILQYSSSYAFDHLFSGMSQMYSHPRKDLIIPFKLLPSYACRDMFANCSNITKPPQLLATTLNDYCYVEMFNGCTNLQTAPALPVTTLKTGCYNYMFSRCYSLTESPVLPAPTLVANCYQGMFNACTSLNKITCLATNISASSCTTNWTNGVAATGVFVKNYSNNSWATGVNGIPTGWTAIGGLVQIIPNGNFANGLTSWTTNAGDASVNNGVLTLTKNNSGSGARLLSGHATLDTTHQYYISCFAKTSNSTAYIHFSSSGAVSGNTSFTGNSSDWTRIDGIASPANAANTLCVRVGTSSSTNGETGDFKNVMVIDLTASFGAGNEPNLTTCKNLFTEEYYKYLPA